ncbi:hypothetical protein [Methanolobus sp.]|uniref:hypothetical protein n=1 Tax=Methanolobus sp. TaxID=1874737 RepID=UPI0025D23B9D|nr:hypothetical protein [Methanolobus sp.]
MKEQGLLQDTRAIDTVPLKMAFYLALMGIIIVLVAVSWSNISPFFRGYQAEEQLNDLSVELLSIQKGYTRNLEEVGSTTGSMCTVRLSLPDNVRYLALGVDPDPDIDGNLSNTAWNTENNTMLIQYNNGVRNRFIIEGEHIGFRQGSLTAKGSWELDPYSIQDNMGIIIENPVNGEYIFELVFAGEKYTLSHF